MKSIERFYEYLAVKGIKPTAFEKSIGLSNGYLSAQKKRNADMGESIMIKIIDNCRDINANWLLTGKGSMIIENKYNYEIASSENHILKEDKPQKLNHSDHINKGIPLIPLSAMAGYTSGSCTVLDYECEKYVIPMFKDAEFLIPVKGQSMQPKFNCGDIVACKKLPLSDIFFLWNKGYVIDTVQGPLIKRIKKGCDNNHILIVSDNESYEPFELHKNQINAIAIVIGVVRLE